ncbi:MULTISPECIES: DUF4956 domain-containing protein [Nocardiopsis]|uniref:DUF4956 domain-containing protein n=1 Tax=Nocardiopsis dassonvillei (strain ATCC 23218 / DSM 43111 / CIP 107115 / JCM 7437 / KCTC 9190 / NBRC 14626 / NCTC 10488 / NRRL B-5397 / IMRU 509) TaxID=446468 RepID=D7B5H7_NOCDD|nr:MULTISPECIES: DUF4956 domain-containing protein [Nocardiopsis]ADH67244.1 conserved hypothetical protein [Nocardiopsis dassonvillei subsp. dassonvillei DSM 43111]APC35471.1 DUF4956 domain-containing protein [Nocardiopsis dassonvillei]NKY80726.1 DUF4956 domain-containing protein [Nocardiopsis dassonvillei]VEI87320.1 Uncharacterised protein [Nocardiopsis dassonvillei]
MNLDFGVTDLSGTFSVMDVVLSLTLAFVTSLVVAWTYRATHRNISYSQSYVHTLIILGMLIALIMLVVGSNIARAFALVGALSVVRFRNAIKETRDVGFIFLVMGVGMACGTRFYTLAVIATVVICAVVLLMHRFNWFALNVQRQVVKVQVPADGDDYGPVIDDVLIRFTDEYELISTETVRGGSLLETAYTARLKKGVKPGDVVQRLREINAGQKATVLTGYDQTDL